MAWCCGRCFILENGQVDGSKHLGKPRSRLKNRPKRLWPASLVTNRMHVVLVEPEIPPNTGNVARLCAATRTTLHLIEPFGFQLDDKNLKRAGMDYWRHVEWHRWKNWSEFEAALPAESRLWFVESEGPRHHTEVEYEGGDYLVFGRETAGLPG